MQSGEKAHNNHPVNHNDRSKLKVNLKVIEFVWKTHQNDPRNQLSDDGIINHVLIMYSKGAKEQNTFSLFERNLKSYQCILLSSTVSVHNSPMVHNTFIRKSTTRIILVGLPYEFDDLEIDLQL